MKTFQEIFDTVLFGLRAQGVASVSVKVYGDGDESVECMYRGDSGTKCAAGMLLPDEAYRPEMEDVAATQAQDTVNRFQQGKLAVWPVLLAAGVPPTAASLVQWMQIAHDDYMPRTKGDSMQVWEARMRCIALQFNLHYTEPK
jgi:hypothetical protein